MTWLDSNLVLFMGCNGSRPTGQLELYEAKYYVLNRPNSPQNGPNRIGSDPVTPALREAWWENRHNLKFLF